MRIHLKKKNHPNVNTSSSLSYTDVDCQSSPSTVQQYYRWARHSLSFWAASVTSSIWKGKGNFCEYDTYSPIRLLCHAMKIFEGAIDASLWKIVSISPSQCGFNAFDAIHTISMLLERHQEKNQLVHMAFLDLEKAFNRLPLDLIWHSLHYHSNPQTNSSTPTPPVLSDAPLACPNGSKSLLAYIRDLSPPRSCLSFAWTRPRWIFRHLNSGPFYSLLIVGPLWA